MKLSYLITFAVGALSGAVPAYFITRNIERKRADEEIAAYKEHVDKKISELESKIKTATQCNTSKSEAPKDEEPSIEDLSKKVDDAVENYNKTKERIKYQGHMSVDEAYETGDQELIKAAEWMERRDQMLAEGQIKGQDGSPQVIDMLTYIGEGDGEYTYQDDYDHVSLDWYAGDGILAYANLCEVNGEEHEMGEIVEKPNFVVGWKWKQHFGDPDFHNDDDCVYVRNDFLKTDFEIIRDAGKNKEIVLGDYSDEESENDGDTSEE